MQQQSNQQMYSGDLTTGGITSWVKGIQQPDILSHLVRETFGQIDQLEPGLRDQVFNTLRNDAKFTSVVEKFQPQTA